MAIPSLQHRLPLGKLLVNYFSRSLCSSWWLCQSEQKFINGRVGSANSDNRLQRDENHRLHEESELQYQPGPDLMNLPGEHVEMKHTNRTNQQERRNHNYGLAGRAKAGTQTRYKVYIPHIRGEVLFGTFPVLLTLKQKRRTSYALHLKKSHLHSDKPLIKEILSLCDEQDIHILPTDKRTLDRLSYGRPHQGFCLDTTKIEYKDYQHDCEMREFQSPDDRYKMWLFLDRVQDPMNFGSIIRSSYFLGVDRIILTEADSCPPSPVVSKASAGALEVMDIYTVKDVISFIREKKSDGWNIVGTTGPSSELPTVPLNDARLNSNTMLMLGNEGKGLSQEIESLCDQFVTISSGRQLATGVDSLNVSVASGILLHQLLLNRN